MGAVRLYVDGDNLFYLQKETGWKIDQKKLLSFTRRFGDLTSAAYYAGEKDDPLPGRAAFFTLLAGIGYRLVTKPLKRVEKGGEFYEKSTADMWMCRDIILELDTYDTAVIVTGDEDFECVLEALRTRGKEFRLLSTESMVATRMKAAAGMNYLDFNDYRDVLERTDYPKGGIEDDSCGSGERHIGTMWAEQDECEQSVGCLSRHDA